MKILTLPLTSIKEGQRAREDYGNIEELAESIKEQGLLQPITVTPVNGGYRLLAGGRRLRAASLAGLDSLFCIVREIKGEENALEIELTENIHRRDFTWLERCKLEKSIYDLKASQDPNWSQRKTASLLGRTRSALFQDIELASAVEHVPELASAESQNEAWKKWTRLKEDIAVQETVKRQEKEAKAPSDDAPVPPASRGKFKSFLEYINTKYAIGDALGNLAELNPSIVDFVEVDPPYAVDFKVHRKKTEDRHAVDIYNELSEEDYPEFLDRLTSLLYPAMSDNSWGIFWYGSKWYAHVCLALQKAGFKYTATPAIWVKIGGGYSPNPSSQLANLYENFIVFRKGNPALLKPGRANVFQFPQPPYQGRIHPTERPVELIKELLETFTTEASVICSPFLGSGTTLRAAFETNRVCFGWDINSTYKDRLIAREIPNA